MMGFLLLLLVRRRRCFSTTTTTSTSSGISNLYTNYSFTPPPSLLTNHQLPKTNNTTKKKKKKPLYRPPSSLVDQKPPLKSHLPFDFRFSYTESSPAVRPIGLREPKYSPFGPDRVDRVWTGVCAPAVPTKEEAHKLEAHRKKMRDRIQGHDLTNAERLALVNRYGKHKTKTQINLGRDGLTHNMLNDIHNNWKHAEAVRIKCMGVPTVDMQNVCTQLEDKAFAKNGYYGGLVPMIRDAFLVEELVRIDCQGLERKDYKKLGAKLRDLVPCILVTFEKEQIVIWRGKDYKPKEGGCFLMDRQSFDKTDRHQSQHVNHCQIEFDSDDEK
ncbi:hypothetical protein M8C21_032152 [Ambrosia artemisiifolia]|uniref:CRM domain-containing protein n=1 Tax=Ambrosia artemisiifolia TaxID=4212 RepID=A0AAD5CAU6_AMBAR|nr:hypothetical protein M8C21_032152 [Ambrosia artemisiifolia]